MEDERDYASVVKMKVGNVDTDRQMNRNSRYLAELIGLDPPDNHHLFLSLILGRSRSPAAVWSADELRL